MSALFIAAISLLPLAFLTSVLLLAALSGVVVITRALLKDGAYLEAGVYGWSFVIALLPAAFIGAVICSFDETPRDRSFYTPQLYDSCSHLRWLFSCGRRPDPLSRTLAAIRCADYSLITEPIQELRPGNYDLGQQCFGG